MVYKQQNASWRVRSGTRLQNVWTIVYMYLRSQNIEAWMVKPLMTSDYVSQVAQRKLTTLDQKQEINFVWPSTTFSGCLSCISVTKECYQIWVFLESSLRSFFFSYIS